MNAIIIGGTSGIGKELSILLAQNNYRVAVTGRRINKLLELQQLFPDNVIVKQHDVIDYVTSESILNELAEELKIIDLVVYSSGVGEPNYDLEWEKELPTLETNILAAAKVYGWSYRLFKGQGFGHLVGISSIAGIRGNRHVPAYFASKAFQNNYLESLWLKGKRSKADITVTDIIPGFVNTDMAKGKTFWMATPQKAAQQIFRAIQKKKKKAYITKRWILMAFLLKIIPSNLLLKM